MTATYPLARPSAFAANVTNPLATLDSDLVNLTDTLNGLGNGVSVLQSVTITTGSITNANISLMTGNVSITGGSSILESANITTFNAATIHFNDGTSQTTAAAASAGNATATIVGGAAINGSASTFMRSDAAPALALTTGSTVLGTTVTLGTGFTQVLALTLGAGTWLVWIAMAGETASGPSTQTWELTDGTTVYMSGADVNGVSTAVRTSHGQSVITLASSTTLNLKAKYGGTVVTVQNDPSGVGGDETYIKAVRIG